MATTRHITVMPKRSFNELSGIIAWYEAQPKVLDSALGTIESYHESVYEAITDRLLKLKAVSKYVNDDDDYAIESYGLKRNGASIEVEVVNTTDHLERMIFTIGPI